MFVFPTPRWYAPCYANPRNYAVAPATPLLPAAARYFSLFYRGFSPGRAKILDNGKKKYRSAEG
jgi:hypothetical protein